LNHPDLNTWLGALERRRNLPLPISDNTMLRLIHTEGNGLRCDRYGSVCWFYWYRPSPPSPIDLDALAYFTHKAGAQQWLLHWMHDRGKNPHQQRRWSSTVPLSWHAAEHGIHYLLKADQGLSPGLFLDQRQNRRWVLDNAANKNVLNLFCYTGGFSLCATRGQATSLTSVDTSKRTLDWARENFVLNHFNTDRVEFWTADAQFFLNRCHKRGRKFDLIICDPPSFARNKAGVFVLERDLGFLLDQVWRLLSPGGRLLLSTNYEKWNANHFIRYIDQTLAGRTYRLEPLPVPDGDFEADGQAAILKGTLIAKF